jgi:asparagine synthase (glutamine-hydrolysing)
MCGIVGHYSRDGAPLAPGTLVDLIECVRHRGPDDSTFWQHGRYAFGHRRLAIIDLAAGRQPMASADGAIVITFNGEIYNYPELREELVRSGHAFRTSSDTEVLINGYRQWGRDLLPKLRGMFAFAIADRSQQQLLLARDRFGEKPLMYLDDEDGTTFASELTPLSRIARRRELDPIALGHYLTLNYVPADATMFAGVKRLPPASWRLYSADGKIEQGMYWSPPAAGTTRAIDMATAVRELDALLDRAAQLTLRSDVPVGIFLSSGIDSSLVARAAARAGTVTRAFSLGFAEQSHDEVPGARQTAAQLGIPITEVTLTASALERFVDLVAHADDPLADSSALAVWTLAEETAKHVKVVLAGDGGDELFGGYLTYPATLWHASLTSRLPRFVKRALAAGSEWLPTGHGKVTPSYKLMRYLRAMPLPAGEAHFSWNGTWLPHQAAALLHDGPAREAAIGALQFMAARHRLGQAPSLAELQRADLSDYLVNDILVKSDRMSMAHGLEVRAPFLDADLAEFALALPDQLKAGRSGPGKRVLRALAEKTYGVNLAGARKQGFSIPVHEWLRGPARPLVDDLLSPASLEAVPVLDGPAIARVTAQHLSGQRAYGWELWGLMVLVAWHRQQIQGTAHRPIRAAALPQPIEI